MSVDPHIDKEYDNRARVPEHPVHIAGWQKDAADYRDAATAHDRAVFDLSYGPDPRHVLDLFGPDAKTEGASASPILLFIHGGYWRGLDKSFFSHLAKGANAHGVTVAIPSYRLCPAVTIAEIIDDVRQATRFIHARTGRKMAVAGHSAGGHLTAAMLGTDWQAIDPALPKTLTRKGYALSGLFDLLPMIKTQMNSDFKLTEPEARCVSPAFWTLPPDLAPELELDAVVGGEESDEYFRQSALIDQAWGQQGAKTCWQKIPDANHFTVIAPMSDPQSVMTARLVELAQQA
jgi:arylformamidase